MNSNLNYFEDLKTIKEIMERSNRFLSLSGLSGLFAGFIALLGGVYAYLILPDNKIPINQDYLISLSNNNQSIVGIQLFIDAALVLVLASCLAIYFSYKKSQRQGQGIWTPLSKRLLFNFLIPLVTGGFFLIILYTYKQWQLIIPGMLIFYGLALVNAGKFTYSEVFYLGLIQILTGLISALFPEYELFFWCFGFGLLHIAYGLFMYRKYEV